MAKRDPWPVCLNFAGGRGEGGLTCTCIRQCKHHSLRSRYNTVHVKHYSHIHITNTYVHVRVYRNHVHVNIHKHYAYVMHTHTQFNL